MSFETIVLIWIAWRLGDVADELRRARQAQADRWQIERSERARVERTERGK